MARVDQRCDALPRPCDGCVHFHALRVASAALDVAVEQVPVNGVEDYLRDLRAGSVIEEDEAGLLIERGKLRSNPVGWKGEGAGGGELLIEHDTPDAGRKYTNRGPDLVSPGLRFGHGGIEKLLRCLDSEYWKRGIRKQADLFEH